MGSVWDYIMRRKPVFLGYFALFLVSVFASYGLLNTIISQNSADSEQNIVQESPKTENYDRVLSPELVATLVVETDPQISNELSIPEPPISQNNPPSFVQIDIVTPVEPDNIIADNTQPSVDVPLTSVPQRPQVSIFRTILAVLLAVASLTLAGCGLYQTYEYFSPLLDKSPFDRNRFDKNRSDKHLLEK